MADENKLTIAQILNEAATFRYSQEYYELYKECAEADLMATWLEAQEFKAENEELLALGEGVLVESTYLVEDSSLMTTEEEKKNAKDNIKNKWTDKIKNIFDRLIKFLIKICNAVIVFFEKLMISDSKLNDYKKELRDGNYKVLKGKGEEVKKILKKNYKKSKLWEPATDTDIKAGRLNLYKAIVGPGKISEDSSVSYASLMELSLGDGESTKNKFITIYLSRNVNVCKIEDFSKFTQKLLSKVTSLDFKDLGIYNTIDNGANQRRIDLLFDTGNISRLIAAFKEMLKKFKELDGKPVDNALPASNATKVLNYSTKVYEGIQNLITIYKEIYSIKKNTIVDLYNLVKNDKKSEEDKSKKDK